MDILYPIVELEKSMAYIEAIEEKDETNYDDICCIKNRIQNTLNHLYGTGAGKPYQILQGKD